MAKNLECSAAVMPRFLSPLSPLPHNGPFDPGGYGRHQLDVVGLRLHQFLDHRAGNHLVLQLNERTLVIRLDGLAVGL